MAKDAFLFLSYWITRCGQYIVTLIFFRFVHGSELAAVNLLLPAFGLLSSLLTFGQERYLIQEVRATAASEELRDSIFGNVVAVNLPLVCISGIALLFTGRFAGIAMCLAAAAYAIVQIGATYDGIKPKIANIFLSRAVPAVLMVASAAIAVTQQRVVLWFFSVCAAGLSLLALVRYRSRLAPNFVIPRQRVEMFGYFIIMLFSGWLPTFVGRYVLHSVSDDTAVNTYSAVTLLYQVLVAFSIAYTSTWTYKVISADDASFNSTFRRHAVRHVVLFTVIAAIAVALFPFARPFIFPTVTFADPMRLGMLCGVAFLLYLPYLVTVDFLQINGRNRSLAVVNFLYGAVSAGASVAIASWGVDAMLLSLALANTVASLACMVALTPLLRRYKVQQA